MMKTTYTYLESPVGTLLVTGDDAGALTGVHLPPHQPPPPDWHNDAAALDEAIRQLHAYFAGRQRRFDLRLAPAGTAFQQRVWSELTRIDFAQTISYGELARRVGSPSAARAVGAANGRNPISIVIPCHRVIGANGDLTGYGGGLAAKELLLQHEQRVTKAA
jgi:methylated-DNA-[protein]-cysteine S-methyltransferase